MPQTNTVINHLREHLQDKGEIEEKKMFGGLCFMVNDKMCICVKDDYILCRIDPALEESLVEQPGVRPMSHNGKGMKGYVYVSLDQLSGNKKLLYWADLCLEFNPRANASKKKTTKKK